MYRSTLSTLNDSNRNCLSHQQTTGRYASTHGAFAWQGDGVRRGVFFQYHSRHIEQPNPVLGGFRNHYTWESVAKQLSISVADDARTLVSMAMKAKPRL
eukprot:SAG31_NODE_104_length_25069_cov_12.917144_13_plen_99_part_00